MHPGRKSHLLDRSLLKERNKRISSRYVNVNLQREREKKQTQATGRLARITAIWRGTHAGSQLVIVSLIWRETGGGSCSETGGRSDPPYVYVRQRVCGFHRACVGPH